jgi:SAM-dependent methyltransferase
MSATLLEPRPIDKPRAGPKETTAKVLNFYKELPFNYYSNVVDGAIELLRSNKIKDYPVLHKHLLGLQDTRVLDVGCGGGWFVNSCAHYYEALVTGLELNPVALKQAHAVARLIPGCEENQFIQVNLFDFQPERPFAVVNSLGVLHHTPDCHAAIRRALTWVAPDGHLHLGLYHLYGRQPFLDHFARLKDEGASKPQLYEEFARLNPSITDETHMLSWFRDQVLHPHETQHTYEEIHGLLASEGFTIEATSINKFKPLPSYDKVIELERQLEIASRTALYKKGHYYPGFFVVWARRG